MTPENARAFRDIFKEFDKTGQSYDAEWRMMWYKWGATDPQGAVGFLKQEIEQDKVGYGSNVLGTIFSSWAESDPSGAQAALAEISDAPLFEAAYMGIVKGMDLFEATRFANGSQFEDKKFASVVAENLAERSLRKTNSIEELKGWYQSLAGTPLQEAAVDHVYWRIKRASIDDAAGWVNQLMAGGWSNPRIVGEIAGTYAGKDPLKGLDWYYALPENARPADKLPALIKGADRNPELFAAWKTRNPNFKQDNADHSN